MVHPSATLLASVASAAFAGVAVGLYLERMHPAHPSARPSPSSGSPDTLLRRLQRWWGHGRRRRTTYFPKRLIFVRHGESEGNIDPLLYCHVPDNAMHLTSLGMQQALAAGRSIKKIVGDESMRFIVSPYTRTIETFRGITRAWGAAAKEIPWSEEPRIREQDFGNFQEPVKIRECKMQRRRFGTFFYRFPSGESPADVYDRISSFLESLHRLFAKTSERNYVMVTHGVSIRVILTRYFKYRVAEFEMLENFRNGEFVVLEFDPVQGRYHLQSVVSNHVTLQDDGSVDVQTEEATTLRVYPTPDPEAYSPSSPSAYPSSPTSQWFQRKSPSSECGFSTGSTSDEMDADRVPITVHAHVNNAP